MTSGSLVVERLSVWAGTKPIVTDINLAVKAGGVVALLGRSGSGKSTVINAIAGVTDSALRTQGRITYPSGRVVDAVDQRPQERIGFLPQHALKALNPVISVGRILDEIAWARGDKDSGSVKLSLGALGFVPELWGRTSTELSAGERQRVLLAATGIGNPGLIVSDEPTSAVDALAREEVLRWMLMTAKSRNVPVLFATHDWEAAKACCDEAVILRDGRIENVVTPDGLLPRDFTVEPSGRGRAVVLSATNVSFSVGGRPILDSVSLKTASGSVTGLLGRNGSGKSTLARCVAGLERQEGGEIVLFHEGQPQNVSAPTPRVQMVFQDPHASFDPRRSIVTSIVDAVALGCKRNDRDRILAEATESLARVGVSTAVAARIPASVSGGECQRAAIVRATMLRPDVLIADEPTSSLDVPTGMAVLKMLSAFARDSGASVILITHDLVAARQMCESVCVLDQGRVTAAGRMAEIVDSSSDAIVDALRRASPLAEP
jgi:peptide/nickel transport system ATP-binding protein